MTSAALVDVLRQNPGPAAVGVASRAQVTGSDVTRPDVTRPDAGPAGRTTRQAGCWYAPRFSYAFFAFVFTSAGGSIRGARLNQ